jgi:hypothetical protein
MICEFCDDNLSCPNAYVRCCLLEPDPYPNESRLPNEPGLEDEGACAPI